MTKRCYVCSTDKDESEFYKSKRTKDKLRFECKVCSNIASTAYAKANWKEKIRPKARGYRLKHRYGITEEQYKTMLADAGGCCEICGDVMKETGNGYTGICIDHCHITGAVRGLLCGSCNSGLGKLKDSKKVLQAAIVYLEKYGTDLETSS